MSDIELTSENQAVIDFATGHLGHEILNMAGPDGKLIPIAVLPRDKRISHLKEIFDAHRDHPERREGYAEMHDAASMVAHINRFKNKDSAIFCDRTLPSIQAVYDYHDAVSDKYGLAVEDPKPQFCRHRASYNVPLSDEWKAWKNANCTGFTQAGFAEFLENNLADVITPPKPDEMSDAVKSLLESVGGQFASPSRLMELARGLSATVTEKVQSAVNLSSGEVEVRYATEHTENGKPLKVPGLLMIAIPVFVNGPLYRIAVRLRYRLKEGSVTWFFNLFQADKALDDAFNEACLMIATETGLPHFMGLPE